MEEFFLKSISTKICILNYRIKNNYNSESKAIINNIKYLLNSNDS